MDGTTPTVNSAELIATLFAFIPIPVAVADEGGSIVIANSSFKEIFNSDAAVSFMSQREIEIPSHGIFEVQTLPMNDQGYRIVYATDVSIQARLGKKVELLEKMAAIGRVVGGVAHELQSPLKDIMDYGPMIGQCEMDSKARSIIDAVFASTERASHLVENLISFAGNAESPQVPFDLNEIVRNVMAQRCASDSWRQFDVTLDLERNLPRTVGRPSQIEQVITALMLNAEDAVARVPHGNGSILVQTGVRAGRVQVQVADNGQARDSARMFSAGHANVGLNICAEIAKDHGGDLFVWSSYGNGSTFTVELPIYAQQKPETASSANVTEILWNKSVLVIDDEIHISELIEDVLSLRGANVRVFNSGTEAYEHLFSNEFDLIICNQSMPGLSGVSLYRLMERANPSMNQRFLFITEGMITAHDRQFFAETGVQYLRKPFRIQDLVDAIEGVLSRSLPRGF